MHPILPSGARHLATLVGSSEAIVAIRQTIDRLAASDVPVLVTGPSGSGKAVVADLLHQRGARALRPFVVVNCAVRRDPFASDRREADAVSGGPRRGPVERANRGTLFLDEIGDLGADGQDRLLRILTTGEVARDGGPPSPVDVRTIAATAVDLADAVAAGHFRADLFDRLAGVTIALPPLAERRDDIPLLVDYFAHLEAARGPRPRFAASALAYLRMQAWPGNVRELRTFVARAATLHPGVEIEDARAAVLLHGERRVVDRWLDTAAEPLPLPNRRRPRPIVAASEVTDLDALFNDFERAYIRDALGHIAFGVDDSAHAVNHRRPTLN